MSRTRARLNRRRFVQQLAGSTAALAPWFATGQAPAFIRRELARPQVPCGVASGDVTATSAMIWSRTDRPAQMWVEFSTNDAFRDARRVRGPTTLAEDDFTAKLDLIGLPSGQQIFYRVLFQDLGQRRVWSEPQTGTLRTPSKNTRDVMFAWSGDTAGQGFGINVEWGGMKIYESIRRMNPDFFIHSGDLIYADNPIPAEVPLDDGKVWKNVTTEAKSKVAETLAEFRGNYAYNLLDENVRRFNAQIPQLVQWDDHETVNNWYPGETIDDERYTVKSASLLAARARRALFDYNPIRQRGWAPQRIHRRFNFGPLLDVFMLDLRSFRGPNSENRQAERSWRTAYLGNGQLRWLKRNLLESSAAWKVIASDMPLGLIVRDGTEWFENGANGDGPPLGRELEVAELLRFIKANSIRNVVWLTADVHYAAAHHYDPARAKSTEFDPFWEFVAGPLNAGNFGPNPLDDTFGPQVEFLSIPPDLPARRPPSDGLQFFGTVKMHDEGRVMTVALHKLSGDQIYQVELPAV